MKDHGRVGQEGRGKVCNDRIPFKTDGGLTVHLRFKDRGVGSRERS